MIEIVAPGPFACLQDAGRPGYTALGVPRSGAFDRGALRLANLLVGNRPGAAAVELTLGAMTLVAHDAVTLALAGAACPGDLSWGVPATVPAGTRLRIGVPPSGVRSYLAVRGGVATAAVLGSRSTDTLSGLGPAPLRAGDRLYPGREQVGDVSGAAAAPRARRERVRVVAGPREDWFVPDAFTTLTRARWAVRADSNRIGVRLDGPPLVRRTSAELPSEATLPGAVQVPPDGRPIVLGPDGPVTGGYPVIAVLREADLDVLAQLRPGDTVGFSA